MINQIYADIKTAMIKKNKIKKEVLKMVLNKAKDSAKVENIETPTDEMVVKSIQKEIKQMNQTISMLKGKEDTSLYKESIEKIEILKTYLD